VAVESDTSASTAELVVMKTSAAAAQNAAGALENLDIGNYSAKAE
jgi:hypothetical protein